MANLQLFEVTQSQLSSITITNGQLIVCTDTGNFYRDLENRRIALGNSVEKVTSLPLAPIADKIYLLTTSHSLWYFNEEWIQLSNKALIVQVSAYSQLPAVGSESCLYVVKNLNKTYRWDDTDNRYYCIGSDYNDINVIDGGTA